VKRCAAEQRSAKRKSVRGQYAPESTDWAEEAWNIWIEKAEETGLAPVVKVAQMVKNHLWDIVNAVVLGVSNAQAESINSKIKILNSRARGFRCRDRFRRAILFNCGNLDLSF